MCGIIGAWLANDSWEKQEFEEVVDCLHHRGPDERGVFIENGFYLGMRRLSIIDLATGSQPIFNEDKSKLVLFNGEVYNYKELVPVLEKRGHQFSTQSDTEVIVHSLEEGMHTVESFRGMFAISHYDRTTKTLTLIRDRVGVKPLYYYHEPGRCFFYSSELKGILALAKKARIELKRNEEAIYHYLSFANIPQPLTIYKNVFALLPGHSLTFQYDKIKVSMYWDYSYQPKFEGTFEEAKEHAQILIRDSVRLRLRSDVSLGIFLSGGLDSSVVAYEAAHQLNGNLQTFTIGLPDSPELDESSIAHATAQQLGIHNEILPLKVKPLDTLFKISDVYDQPFADPSAIPSLEISRMAQGLVKVILNGDGGDEQFGGYRRYGLAKQLSVIPNLAWMSLAFGRLSKNRRSVSGLLDRVVRISGLDTQDQYISLTTDILLDSEKQEHWLNKQNQFATTSLIKDQQLKQASTLDRVMHLDRRFNLLSGLLVKMDMATSAYSLEGRSPFLDHTLFEFTSRLPDHFKYRGSTSKYLLRKLYADKLSDQVVRGVKKGFEIPLRRWLAYDFAEVIETVTTKKDLSIYEYLPPDFVKECLTLKVYPEKNQGYLAYSILNLAIWLDRTKF